MLNHLYLNENIFLKQPVFENIPRSFLELSGITVLIITAIVLNFIANLEMKEILSYMAVLGISFVEFYLHLTD